MYCDVILQGHGNMARKMGIRYDRIDVSSADSTGDGARVPAEDLGNAVQRMIRGLVQEPTCVLPAVIDDPYLESVL